MKNFLRRLRGKATDPDWAALDDLADNFALPRAWVVCAHCGAMSWRLPPHEIGQPCPYVAGMAEVTGLKFDAERSTAVRAGVQIEEMTRALRQMVEPEEEE